MSDIDKSISFVKKFARKYLNDDLDNLLVFPLAELIEDKTFGCPQRRFDADDTDIMRHLYIVLFHDVWPDMTFESLKTLQFRGDTLNTYNTMFGEPKDFSPHPGLDNFNPSDALREKVISFKRHFSLIGNMVVLPNVMIGRETINTYRGKHGKWHDFFDLFLAALKDILTGKQPQDIKLANLIEANEKYFARYKGEQGFRSLINGLILTDYVNADFKPIILSKGYYWWMKKVTSEDYQAEAIRYIDCALSVIDHRTKLMINKLKLIIKDI